MKTLKNVLLINALSSGATGLLLIVFSVKTANLFGYSESLPFEAIGVFLVAFATYVFAQGRRTTLNKTALKLIIALDIIWVIESVAFVSFQLFGLTSVGYFLILAAAVWVGFMAFLQIKGLRTIASMQV